jgi:putative SOS response-associated peptidase YedK
MCGRYTHLYTWRQLHRLMTLTTPPLEFEARYNVAPTQAAPVVRQDQGGVRSAAMLQWGLVPSWAKDASICNSLINARAETVAEKPAFRAAFKSRRCIVPVSGFYEWKGAKGSKGRQPYYIVPNRLPVGPPRPVAAVGNGERAGEGGIDAPFAPACSRAPGHATAEHACAESSCGGRTLMDENRAAFAERLAIEALFSGQPQACHPSGAHDPPILLFPGLWESWRTPSGDRLETYVIITVAANEWMKPLHDRIPAMLAPGPEAEAWLDPATPPEKLSDLLHPPGDDWLTCWPVSTRVNSPAHEDPSLIQPLEQTGSTPGLFG